MGRPYRPGHPALQCGHAQGDNELGKATEGDLVTGPTCAGIWPWRGSSMLGGGCSSVESLSPQSLQKLFHVSFLGGSELPPDLELGNASRMPSDRYCPRVLGPDCSDSFLWRDLIASGGHDVNWESQGQAAGGQFGERTPRFF